MSNMEDSMDEESNSQPTPTTNTTNTTNTLPISSFASSGFGSFTATAKPFSSNKSGFSSSNPLSGFNNCSKCKFLSLEEYEAAVNDNPACEAALNKANSAIGRLQQEVDRQLSLVQQANINMCKMIDDMEERTTKQNYEQLYMTLRSEYEKIVLQSVKMASELESLKKVSGHAISALSDVSDDNNNAMQSNGKLQAKEKAIDSILAGDDATSPAGDLDVFNDIAALLKDMEHKMTISGTGVQAIELEVLIEFLDKLKLQKIQDRNKIEKQVEMLSIDIDRVKSKLHKVKANKNANTDKIKANPFGFVGDKPNPNKRRKNRGGDDDDDIDLMGSNDNDSKDEANTGNANIDVKKRRVISHMDELMNSYFETKEKDGDLNHFTQRLTAFTKYNDFKSEGTLLYLSRAKELSNHRHITRSCIISSISFCKDEDYFGIAGTLNEIQVYKWNDVLQANTAKNEQCAPVQVMTNFAKLSCISWNPSQKEQLASSDYNGTISLWDSQVGKSTANFKDHKKRSWCVDWSVPAKGLFASASEDYTVKLWHTSQQQATATIFSHAEVCSVKFNPVLENMIAFSCADQRAYYYDIRNLHTPVKTFGEHRKTVCDVDFVSHEELLTQSIDSSLKRWSLKSSSAASLQTYTGHENKMRFTGVHCHGDYIACGSEDNTVVLYTKLLKSPMLKHSFQSANSTRDRSTFVSAVCWKPSANILLAGNSKGILKVLSLE